MRPLGGCASLTGGHVVWYGDDDNDDDDDGDDDDDDDVVHRESEDEQHWFWIGLNRRNPMDNGSWKWSDGVAVSKDKMQPWYECWVK